METTVSFYHPTIVINVHLKVQLPTVTTKKTLGFIFQQFQTIINDNYSIEN